MSDKEEIENCRPAKRRLFFLYRPTFFWSLFLVPFGLAFVSGLYAWIIAGSGLQASLIIDTIFFAILAFSGCSILALVFLLNVIRFKFIDAYIATLIGLAETRGWTFEWPSPRWNIKSARVCGSHAACEVTVFNSKFLPVSRRGFLITVASDFLPVSFTILTETVGIPGPHGRAIVGSDVNVGDDKLDYLAHLSGDEADITAAMSEEARAIVCKMTLKGIHMERDHDQVVRLTYAQNMPFKKVEIDAIIDFMSRAADCLSTSDRPREARLLDNVRNDSDPEVRARNIAMLALYHHGSKELSDALEAVLGSPDEDALIATLAKSESLDRQVAAAIALGRSGSADAVPQLREWASTVDKEYDYARRVGHQSVAAIQARVGPVDGGALSLTEAASGALSEAEGLGGELSVVEEEERRKGLAAAKTTTGI